MREQVTPEQQGRCFSLLDEYARMRHNCFVAEFFLAKGGDAYNVCFRPIGGSENDPNRYACKYLQLDYGDVQKIASGTSLPVAVAAKLDEALPTIPQDDRLAVDKFA